MPTVEDGSEPDSLRVETLAKWGPDRRFGVDVQQPHVDRFAPVNSEGPGRGLSGIRIGGRRPVSFRADGDDVEILSANLSYYP